MIKILFHKHYYKIQIYLSRHSLGTQMPGAAAARRGRIRQTSLNTLTVFCICLTILINKFIQYFMLFLYRN